MKRLAWVLALALVSSSARAHDGPAFIAAQPDTRACICSDAQTPEGLIYPCRGDGFPYYGPLAGVPYPPDQMLIQIVRLERLLARLRAELAAGPP